MMGQDYYGILGVNRSASDEELRQAFRKLARQYHPDVSKGGDAEEKFKKLNEAYEVLKDKEKRALYDKFGASWQSRVHSEESEDFYGNTHGYGYRQNGADGSYAFHTTGYSDPSDIDDILRDLFGRASRVHSSGSQDQRSGFSHNGDAEVELPVTLADLYYGATKHVRVELPEYDENGILRAQVKEFKIKIPQGVTDGSVIRLGRGDGGNPEEKLRIRLALITDSRFAIDGFDLRTEIAVTPWEAALGTKIPVGTVGGEITMKIPQGSNHGTQLRIRGKGLRQKNGSRGDIIVALTVHLPRELSAAEEKLLRELAEISAYNPRHKFVQQPYMKERSSK